MHVSHRLAVMVVLLLLTLLCSLPVFSQSEAAAVSGRVADPQGLAVVGAKVSAVNTSTNVASSTQSNGAGFYNLPSLVPGTYRIIVEKEGFAQIVKPDVQLHVQDNAGINFSLQVGSVTQSVTVEGGAPLVNTESAAVSTVVDRKYVENMPLNGRSLQDLILLTPGVVTNTPQQGGTIGSTGEFSVNGQRTESNYYTVDGVSANTGVYPGDPGGPGNSGSLGAATALGTTQSLVSLDALQEFRVQSSTYSAEYGRNPGGQFSFATRSGTGQWHGTAFDYLRNNYFDANNWFNNYFGVSEPPLRQNDFGGTVGGPINLPGISNGDNKTFFLFSYEGLRLSQPQAASVNYVPDAALRQNTPTPLQEVLNAFPIANGLDLGNGLAEYIGSWSNPNSINAYSVRLDHNFSDKLKVFFRFSDSPSTADARLTGASITPAVPSTLQAFDYTSRTYTFGATSVLRNRLSNDFRLNYSSNQSTLAYTIDNFGGARAVSLAQASQIAQTSNGYIVSVGLAFGNYFSNLQEGYYAALQRQWNLVDSISLSVGRHQIKIGADFRRSAPIQQVGSPTIYYYFGSTDDVQTNNPGQAYPYAFANAYPLYKNFSAFVQDEWTVAPRLTLSMGVRWEVNPAPGVTKGFLPYTVQGAADLSTMTLAPQGTPLWRTTLYNLAPRLGAAYVLRQAPGHETVLRGGGGLFFDTGQQTGTLGFYGPGFSASEFLGYLNGSPVSFPIPATQLPAIAPPTPPYTSSTVFAFPPHLQLPYTLQWNATIEQALGKSQALSIAYVGSHAARLLEWNQVHVAPFNSNFGYVVFLQSGNSADYNALQLQYRQRVSHGLTALAAYTFSHSIDYGSQDSAFPYFRGNSDFDVRHNFSSAFSYDVPNILESRLAQAVLHSWGIDDRFTVRAGFPVTLNGLPLYDPATGRRFFGGLDLVPGEPVYIYGSQCAAVYNNALACPGGRAVNPNAFANPPAGQFGDAPRNFVRGFGAWQMDLAVRREFPIHERLKLQFRAEAFNIFNHVNFGTINAAYCTPGPGCTFGQASQTLNTSLGTLSSLYQMGGPRSMQFALKLVF